MEGRQARLTPPSRQLPTLHSTGAPACTVHRSVVGFDEPFLTGSWLRVGSLPLPSSLSVSLHHDKAGTCHSETCGPVSNKGAVVRKDADPCISLKGTQHCSAPFPKPGVLQVSQNQTCPKRGNGFQAVPRLPLLAALEHKKRTGRPSAPLPIYCRSPVPNRHNNNGII